MSEAQVAASADALIESLQSRLHDYYGRRCKVFPPPASCRASEIGHPCDRYLYHSIRDWQLRKPVTPELQRIFDLGNMHHDHQEAVLRQAGISLQRMNEPFQITERDQVLIQGHVDGFVPWAPDGNSDPAAKAYIPIEIKSMHPAVYDSVSAIADFRRYSWARKYPGQLLMYCYAEGVPFGLFLLVNKSSGDYKFLPMVLTDHLDEAEACLQRAERVRESLALGATPARCVDMDLCDRCDFKDICLPDMRQDPSLIFVDDVAVEAALDERERLEPSAKEFQGVDDRLKAWAKIKTKDGEKYVSVGNWLIRVNRTPKQTRVSFGRLEGDHDRATDE